MKCIEEGRNIEDKEYISCHFLQAFNGNGETHLCKKMRLPIFIKGNNLFIIVKFLSRKNRALILVQNRIEINLMDSEILQSIQDNSKEVKYASGYNK